mmetsp:Transcript_27830/g.31809  ORF Transcript_27830/g.31809 Transcript_27830/m.31809 type:complete len:201 (-) Transcript_27830:248-850(-)|eukprot:CAMPEP_0194139890 /NCGR_PEP_ID=MMETSP0152-20130528/9494_1 /TAXON_ID=1049557 /ORGANISM="Thalassiothrix antarctica, Strain L6-D1" /LENGTH=200 /DNA_ID=CAMNT_0038837889 /DNA_START=78 /DNA_END=680 /DNA_ORIENTATION=-
MSENKVDEEVKEETVVSDLKLDSITDGQNERGIPIVKFVEDITGFSKTFDPPASAELLIGAYSDIFAKFKSYEVSLNQKQLNFRGKIPEIEKSLALVKHLQSHDKDKPLITRYSLADTVYGKAEVDTSSGIVNLWLGANVMLEYEYDEAIALLESKLNIAKKEMAEVSSDLGFTRNQIITAEVNISRIYNWDIRKKRNQK